MLMRAPLDPKQLVAGRRPGYTLDGAFYTSAEIFALDLEAIFAKHWIFVGVEPELPEPGDFVTREIGRDSIIIVRGDDGVARAHFNVCRHRGARLLTADRGTVGKLVCPYHQWTYELTGELIYTTQMGDHFDRFCHGLKPVPLRSIEGLLFVCLAEEPPGDIDEMARVMVPRLAPHGLRNTKVAQQIDLIEEGNWKLTMENNRECYHCASNHPELSASYSKFSVGFAPDPDDEAEVAAAAAYAAQEERLLADWESRGLPSTPVEMMTGRPTGFRTQRLAIDGAGEAHTPDTRIACRRLLGNLNDPQLGDLHFWTQPNSWHHIFSDHAVTFAVFPLSADRTLLRTTWLVRKDAVEGVDYDLDHLTSVWRVTNEQDAALVCLAQKGAGSRAYQPGPYSPLTEALVDQFTTWYVERLAAHLEARER
jgi:Rieske 2Fe-2S family protein